MFEWGFFCSWNKKQNSFWFTVETQSWAANELRTTQTVRRVAKDWQTHVELIWLNPTRQRAGACLCQSCSVNLVQRFVMFQEIKLDEPVPFLSPGVGLNKISDKRDVSQVVIQVDASTSKHHSRYGIFRVMGRAISPPNMARCIGRKVCFLSRLTTLHWSFLGFFICVTSNRLQHALSSVTESSSVIVHRDHGSGVHCVLLSVMTVPAASRSFWSSFWCLALGRLFWPTLSLRSWKFYECVIGWWWADVPSTSFHWF